MIIYISIYATSTQVSTPADSVAVIFCSHQHRDDVIASPALILTSFGEGQSVMHDEFKERRWIEKGSASAKRIIGAARSSRLLSLWNLCPFELGMRREAGRAPSRSDHRDSAGSVDLS